MATPLAPSSLLKPSVAARVAACGHPIQYVTAGKVSHGRWSCGSSWCSWCSERRRARAHSLIRIALNREADTVQMLTLTIPHPEGYSADDLRCSVRLLQELWRGAMSRVRWAVWRDRRGGDGAWDRLQPPRYPDTMPSGTPHPKAGQPHEKFASSWKNGRFTGSARAGVWVREITQGESVGGWHPHVHVLVPSRADAELINAAWQAEVAERALYRRGGGWLKTDIRSFDANRAASYVAKYLTKGDLPKIRPENLAAYIEGSRGMRRCDAWGGWRPLALGRRTESETTHVAQPQWEHAVEVPTYYGEDWLARWLRTGAIPSQRVLEENLNVGKLLEQVPLQLIAQSKDPEVLEASKLAALAVAKSLERTIPLRLD